MRIGRCLLALAVLVASQISYARAAEQVDLLLALAMDVSRSMEQPKFLLQREGYAAAITNPQVLDAIKSGAHQKIAICFIDWSGAGEQKQVIDWSIIDGADSARRFGDLIYEAPRSFNDRTSIGGGITFAAAQIARNRNIEQGYRTVLNVGPGAGQSVFHLHVHLIGGRQLAWPPG